MILLDLFNVLSSMLSSSPEAAVVGAFFWGIASILLSPCHLAAIPLIVGYIDSQGEITTSRAALISTLFSAGILITITLIGIITGLAGRMLGDIGSFGNIAVAIIMVIMGLYLLGIVPIPFLDNGINQPVMKKKGLIASFLLGLFFGLALGPCSFAFMAPMLGVVFTVASSSFIFASLLIAAYAAGHCLIIILAGSFSEVLHHMLKWNNESKGALIIKKGCGILVVAAGIYMLLTAQ